MAINVVKSGQACGATVAGADLTAPLDTETVAEIRAAWLKHHVLAFPDQAMTDDDLERFTLAFGGFGDDPFIAPIDGRDHVIAVERRADETAPLFAENWHSDWSFQATPPSGTCLFGVQIPPMGGDTLYVNQHAALDAMPADLRARLDGKMAVHSARGGYAPDGTYGAHDQATDRSMDIRPSDEAMPPNSTRLSASILKQDGSGFSAALATSLALMAWPIMLPASSWVNYTRGRPETNSSIAMCGNRTC